MASFYASNITKSQSTQLGGTMGKSMSKSEIAAHLAEKFGLKKKVATEILVEVASLAYREAKNQFVLPGLGKVVLVERAARMGRNPATGEQIQIPARKVLKFRFAKVAKDTILGPKK